MNPCLAATLSAASLPLGTWTANSLLYMTLLVLAAKSLLGTNPKTTITHINNIAAARRPAGGHRDRIINTQLNRLLNVEKKKLSIII